MDEQNLRRIEFNKILQKLSEHARSPLGIEIIENTRPRTNLREVKQLQDETTEGRELMRLEPGADISGWEDVRTEIDRAIREIVLEPKDLERIRKTLSACRKIRKFLVERQDKYRILGEIAGGIGNFNTLERSLEKAILPGGEIADNASPELSSVRRKLNSAQQQVKERLDRFVKSPGYQKYLQDPIVTLREGRYVIPVKQEYRGHIQGIVHDQSSSGATLFVEPMPVVEVNNEVRRLQSIEKQEIYKILSSLTKSIATRGEELSYSLECLGQLDYIMAKARYSAEIEAWEPGIESKPVIDIRHGRHPLLAGEVVPVSVHLGLAFDSLVITGPNTGGKTVTLKTVGLLVLMAQAGLHIPCEEGSKIGIFSKFFADIGDEQSIEQSLSTFSSHMSNIVNIINNATPGSLVLLDELGAGTDPVEGAALAQSILDYLHNIGTCTIATTHYSELKNYAYSRERVENASVEFDPVTLRPTFRLLIGKPGRSNAFEIARRLGLESTIIENAKDFMSREEVEISELMNNLEIAKQEAENERNTAEELRKEANTLRNHYRRQEQELEARRKEIIEKARSDAKEIVRRARLESEEVIKQLRQKMEEESARVREEEIRNAREKIKKMRDKHADKEEKKVSTGRAGSLKKVKEGMEVFVPRFNQKGTVIKVLEDKKEVQVQLGSMKINLPVSDLQSWEEEINKNSPAGFTNIVKNKSHTISNKLDLRGMYAEDALDEMEKYLDDASIAGLNKVFIIHGKGTGSLRSAVQQKLKEHRNVKTYRLGTQGEGGSGATVVELQ